MPKNNLKQNDKLHQSVFNIVENFHFMPSLQIIGKTKHQGGSFCWMFLYISTFQITNAENSMTLFEDLKLWNHHYLMYGFFSPSNYFGDTERESDFVRL